MKNTRQRRLPSLRTKDGKVAYRPLLFAGSLVAFGLGVSGFRSSGPPLLSDPFTIQVLTPPGEAPFELRFFTTAVKTDSRGRIITGPNSDPVKNIVGAESAGERGGQPAYTKIMFGADYFNGRPDPGTRIDPNHPVVKSGNQYWPFREQPFRSWPTSLALNPAGTKLYVSLPGREGYPDWRVAVVDTAVRKVRKWIDVRPQGVQKGTRPSGITVSPLNPAIFARPYLVVLNSYANCATVVDTGSDTVLGHFPTGFYAEKALFNVAGDRLYVTDRFKDEVRAFRIDPGPKFTQIAEISTGSSDLQRCNPRDLDLSSDGRTLYVANTLGHTIAAIDVGDDANKLKTVMPVGGLCTDVKIAGNWGLVAGHETNSILNHGETGHGLPKVVSGSAIRNNGQPLGYQPVMTDATKATTFDDIGSEINVFDTRTNQFVYRYVDKDRDLSMLVTPGSIVDLKDHQAAQKIIKGSGPEQVFISGDFAFVTMLHSDKIEVFHIDRDASVPSGILKEVGIQLTGGITPQGVAVAPDGRTVYTANMLTEDVSFLTFDGTSTLSRVSHIPVGVTNTTPDPTKGSNGAGLFATDEEAGMRWLLTSAYSDDGQKSCGHCHWQSRQDGCQWNVAANAVGGVKVCPQNKDVSDNWPEWYEGLNNDLTAYASACNGEVVNAERVTALFPQPNEADRFKAREEYVLKKTQEASDALGRSDISGKAYKIGYYEMAYLQILWTQNETRRMPNPLTQFPSSADAAKVARGKWLFTTKVANGGAGCADCHHNGNVVTNGVVDNTFQDFNIHEPGVISETTVDNNGPFRRPQNDYFFTAFGPPQDEGGAQNVSSRNTKHLRQLWDSVPRWLHHGDAHSLRELLLPPDSPLLKLGERGFNFRTVRTDHSRSVFKDFLGKPPVVLPTEVPITFSNRGGGLGGDGAGPLYVSLDSPFVKQSDGTLQIDRLGTSNVAPLTVLVNGKYAINPKLAENNIKVIKDTHGKTSQLSASDLDALIRYLLSLE